MYVYDGGQANVLGGKRRGIVPSLFIQGWDKISSTVGLLDGSLLRILEIISLA
jgi:hypothetical protein